MFLNIPSARATFTVETSAILPTLGTGRSVHLNLLRGHLSTSSISVPGLRNGAHEIIQARYPYEFDWSLDTFGFSWPDSAPRDFAQIVARAAQLKRFQVSRKKYTVFSYPFPVALQVHLFLLIFI
ncbi:hypothetical protein ONS96_006301 [Cadophora gregata f. sp. sojae]|nr:hypothetical protein ONS96_006301 [Cadophora gregata f. sp. sojae]